MKNNEKKFYEILKNINEADLNKRQSDATNDALSDKELSRIIDGLMDKHNCDIEKVLDELSNTVEFTDGYNKKEVSEDVTDLPRYKFAGQEFSGVDRRQLMDAYWCMSNGISPQAITTLSDAGKKAIFNDTRKGHEGEKVKFVNLIRDGDRNVTGIKLVTVKGYEASTHGGIFRRPGDAEEISIETAKSIMNHPDNNMVMFNLKNTDSNDPDDNVLYSISNMNMRAKEKEQQYEDWKNTYAKGIATELQTRAENEGVKNKNLLDKYVEKYCYLAYNLYLRGYPISSIEKFFSGSNFNKENLHKLENFYRVNYENLSSLEEALKEDENDEIEKIANFKIDGENVLKTKATSEEIKNKTIAREILSNVGVHPMYISIALPIAKAKPKMNGNRLNLAAIGKPSLEYHYYLLDAVPTSLVKKVINGENIDDSDYIYIQEIDKDDHKRLAKTSPEKISIKDIKEYIATYENRNFHAQDTKNGAMIFNSEENDQVDSFGNQSAAGTRGELIPLEPEEIEKVLTMMNDEWPYSPDCLDIDLVGLYNSIKNGETFGNEPILIKEVLSKFYSKIFADMYPNIEMHNVITRRGSDYKLRIPLTNSNIRQYLPSFIKKYLTGAM